MPSSSKSSDRKSEAQRRVENTWGGGGGWSEWTYKGERKCEAEGRCGRENKYIKAENECLLRVL